jgi:hypothetical protein
MPRPLSSTILETALKLHDRGLWVVPCNGKGAVWKDWQKVRRSRKELAAALDGTKLNISIVLNQSDWIDAECDNAEAESALRAMFDGTIPPTPTWQSARGKHRLFKRPARLPSRAKLDVDGVEFHVGNGKGANAIVPPSIHPSGVRYRWLPGLSLDEVVPAELPARIVERLRASAPQATPATNSDNAIPEGKRNETLFERACQCKRIGLPEETIAATLLDLNRRLCQPPLPEQEVRAIAHSAAAGDTRPKVSTAEGECVTRRLSDVEPEEVVWLWEKRFAAGKLNIVHGDPGVGKTWLVLYVLARVTTGEPFCDGAPCEKGEVLFVTAEDGIADTIRPRLDLLGADVSKAHCLDLVRVDGREVALDLERHLGILEAWLDQHEAVRVVALDPLAAFLGKIDAHRNNEVRGVLGRLAKLAENQQFPAERRFVATGWPRRTVGRVEHWISW